jgi:hypothetical protein
MGSSTSVTTKQTATRVKDGEPWKNACAISDAVECVNCRGAIVVESSCLRVSNNPSRRGGCAKALMMCVSSSEHTLYGTHVSRARKVKLGAAPLTNIRDSSSASELRSVIGIWCRSLAASAYSRGFSNRTQYFLGRGCLLVNSHYHRAARIRSQIVCDSESSERVVRQRVFTTMQSALTDRFRIGCSKKQSDTSRSTRL